MSSCDDIDIRATDVRFDDDKMWVELEDGRAVGIPLAWYPRLANATPDQRDNWEVSGAGLGIHCPRLTRTSAPLACFGGFRRRTRRGNFAVLRRRAIMLAVDMAEEIVREILNLESTLRVIVVRRADGRFTYRRQEWAEGDWGSATIDAGVYDSIETAEAEARQREPWLRALFH